MVKLDRLLQLSKANQPMKKRRKFTALAEAPFALYAGCSACSSGHSHDSEKHQHDHDIVETAVSAGSFETLVAAVKAAGLVDTLKGDGPFTVFAPTDEAFAAQPKARSKACCFLKIRISSLRSLPTTSYRPKSWRRMWQREKPRRSMESLRPLKLQTDP